MACRVFDAPSSSLRWASNAEASSTDAGASLLATETPSFFGSLAIFRASFRAPICDQLVSQAFVRRQVGEHASGSLYCCSTLNGCLIGFRGVCHGLRIAAGSYIPAQAVRSTRG
jgi:hypothetical protein